MYRVHGRARLAPVCHLYLYTDTDTIVLRSVEDRDDGYMSTAATAAAAQLLRAARLLLLLLCRMAMAPA